MEVKSYTVILLGGRQVNYGDLGRCSTTAQVKLKSDATEAFLVFYDPDKTDQVPNNRYANTEGKTPMVFLAKDQYIPHLDLLRNEQPVVLIEAGELWYSGSLRTNWEEVGEGE